MVKNDVRQCTNAGRKTKSIIEMERLSAGKDTETIELNNHSPPTTKPPLLHRSMDHPRWICLARRIIGTCPGKDWRTEKWYLRAAANAVHTCTFEGGKVSKWASVRGSNGSHGEAMFIGAGQRQ